MKLSSRRLFVHLLLFFFSFPPQQNRRAAKMIIIIGTIPKIIIRATVAIFTVVLTSGHFISRPPFFRFFNPKT